VNFSCFVLSRTTQASASLKPDERFGFDLQCQLHPRAGPRCNSRRGRLPGSGQTYSRRARPFADSADSDQAAQVLWLGRDRHKPAREGVRHHPDSVVIGRLRAGAGTAEVRGSNPLRSTRKSETELSEALVAETVKAGASKPSLEVAALYADRLIAALSVA
jgi:hypothetical protein